MTPVPDRRGDTSVCPDSTTNSSDSHKNGDAFQSKIGRTDNYGITDVVTPDTAGGGDLGYEGARPDSGYNSNNDNNEDNQYGYGYAAPGFLGYEDAAPDSDNNKNKYSNADRYGYEDATPPDRGYSSSSSSRGNTHHDPYGYGDAAPDLGYGDVSPDIRANLGYEDATPDLGYGDGSPDLRANLGYEDASPDLGYGDVEPDSAHDDPHRYGRGSTIDDLGYGDGASPDQRDALGYGDASPDGPAYQMGYNDENVGSTERAKDGFQRRARPARTRSDESWLSGCSIRSAATAESYGEYSEADGGGGASPRKNRYRRRGSVTKYSIDAQDTVKQEYDDHANVIDQFRSIMLHDQQDHTSRTEFPNSVYHDHQHHNNDQPTGEEQWQQQLLPPENSETTTAAKLELEQTLVTVSTEDSFDEPTGLPLQSYHGDVSLKGTDLGSPRRLAAIRKKGKEGKKLISRIRRRFSMSS